jgi:aminomethyltransferase
MNDSLAHTPLYDWHAAHGARLVDFAGWSMPIQYTSIVTEHQATRTAVGLFDVSHMGRFDFRGPDTGRFLDSLVTRSVLDMPTGKIRYGLVTNQQGGILDDILVYHLTDKSGPYYQLVVNASNRQKLLAWFGESLPSFDVRMDDRTTETAMIAVQGPRALELVKPLLDVDLAGMKYYTAKFGTACSKPALISRTGYTGEDGCELIVAAEDGLAVWETLISTGEPLGAKAAGLGARDTLRLEAAMPLYGHELTERIDPIQAGLEFAVNLKGRTFPGSTAIAEFASRADHPMRIGLKLEAKRVPREGYSVVDPTTGSIVGEVSSGTFSPTLSLPIAMAYVPPQYAQVGTPLAIDIRGTHEPAVVVSLPFYQRKS